LSLTVLSLTSSGVHRPQTLRQVWEVATGALRYTLELGSPVNAVVFGRDWAADRCASRHAETRRGHGQRVSRGLAREFRLSRAEAMTLGCPCTGSCAWHSQWVSITDSGPNRAFTAWMLV